MHLICEITGLNSRGDCVDAAGTSMRKFTIDNRVFNIIRFIQYHPTVIRTCTYLHSILSSTFVQQMISMSSLPSLRDGGVSIYSCLLTSVISVLGGNEDMLCVASSFPSRNSIRILECASLAQLAPLLIMLILL